MLNIKLSELSQASSIASTDLIAISQDQGGEVYTSGSRKITFGDFSSTFTEKFVDNYGGTIPIIDSSDGVENGDLAIDNGVSPNKIWICEGNTEGSPVWIGVNEMIKNTYSTGMVEGGILSINGGDNTKFDISAGAGYITDNFTDSSNPTVIFVKWNAIIGTSATYIASNKSSEVFLDSSGSVIQQSSAPTTDQFRDYIYIGRLVHNDLATLNSVINLQKFIFNVSLSVSDISHALGSINESGNLFYANVAGNLTIDKNSGETYRYCANYVNDRKAPSHIIDPASAPVSFRYRYQSNVAGQFITTAPTTNIVPGYYDDGSGTLAAVGSNEWTIQRIYYYAGSSLTYLTYGQVLYSKLSDAIAAIPIESPIIETNMQRDASLRSFLVVNGNTTDLSNTTENVFRGTGKLGEALGGGSSGGDVNGPSLSTDNAFAKFDGTTGKLLSDGSQAILDDNGNATFNGKVMAKSNVVTITTEYSIVATDKIILANSFSSAFTVSLPSSASNTGVHIYIKKIDSSANSVIIDPNGSETIDGELMQYINTQYECIETICDGSEWFIV